jgi:hypothetical protein
MRLAYQNQYTLTTCNPKSGYYEFSKSIEGQHVSSHLEMIQSPKVGLRMLCKVNSETLVMNDFCDFGIRGCFFESFFQTLLGFSNRKHVVSLLKGPK